jgi:repressor LexA
MATQLTPRQREILDFIRNTLENLGAPPTRAEIASAFGFASHNAAEEHLKALARKGIIVLEPGSARGIRLVEQLGLPLIGSVAAGSPVLAVEKRTAPLHGRCRAVQTPCRLSFARARPIDDQRRHS